MEIKGGVLESEEVPPSKCERTRKVGWGASLGERLIRNLNRPKYKEDFVAQHDAGRVSA